MVRADLCSVGHAKALRVPLKATSRDLDAGACLEHPEPDFRVGHRVAVENRSRTGAHPDPEASAVFKRARADQSLRLRVSDEDARLDRGDRGVLDDRRRAGVEVDRLPFTIVEAAATEIDPAGRSLDPDGVKNPLVELGVVDRGDHAVEDRDPAGHPMEARAPDLERPRRRRCATRPDRSARDRRDGAAIDNEVPTVHGNGGDPGRDGLRARRVGVAAMAQEPAEPAGLRVILPNGQPAERHRAAPDRDARIGRADDHGTGWAVTLDHEITRDGDRLLVRPGTDVDLRSGGRAVDRTEDRAEVGTSG